MPVIGNLTVSMVAETQAFESGMRKAQQHIRETGSAIGNIQASFTGFGASLLKMGAAAAGIGSIAVAIREIVAAGAQLQTFSSSFTAITGSSTATAAALTLVQNQADKLGFGLNDLRDSYKALVSQTQDVNAAGASSAQIFTTVTNSGRTLQLTADQTRVVMDNMAAALRRGFITVQDLQSGFGGLPNLLKLTADALGLTTAATKRLGDEQGLLATLTLPHVLTQIQAVWGSKSLQAAETMGATFGKLKNTIQEVGEALAKLGGNKVLSFLLAEWELRLKGIQTVADALNKETPLPPDIAAARAGLPERGSGLTAQANAGIDLARANADELTQQALGLQQELTKAKLLADTIAEALAKPNVLPVASDKAQLAAAREHVLALQELYAETLTTLKTRVQAIAAIQKTATAPVVSIKDDAANAMAELKKLQESAKVIQEDAQRSLELFPEERAGILAKQEAALKKLGESLEKLRTHPMVDTDMAAQRTAIAAISAEYQVYRDRLREVQLEQKKLASNEELLTYLRQLQEELEKLRLNDPQVAAITKLRAAPERLAKEQERRELLVADPVRTRAELLQDIDSTQAQLDEATARKAVTGLILDQQKALDELMRSQIAEGQALDAQLDALSKTHQGLGKVRDAQIEATLALNDATEKQTLDTMAVRERNKVKQQQLIDQGRDDEIQRIIDGLTAQRDALLLSENAKVASQMTKLGASPARLADAQGLAANIKLLKNAADAVNILENAFVELASTGKVSLQSLAQELQRWMVSLLIEASGLKKTLTSIIAQGLQSIFPAAGGISQGPLQGPTQSGGTLDVSPNAAGGPVYGGSWNWVGERGAEPFFPSISGRIISHEDAMDAIAGAYGTAQQPGSGSDRPVIVHFTVVTQDAGSFARSRGEINRGLTRTMQQATRDI